MKLEAGKKYRTRGGGVVTIIKTDLPLTYPVVGYEVGDMEASSWMADGVYAGVDVESDYDLMEEYVEPVFTTKYFQLVVNNLLDIWQPKQMTYIEFTPDLEHWDLKITYADDKIIDVVYPK